ncbi:MAG: hypothetical protein KatS3mg114_0041 [Planctomycetaceae bacterium]|nr:MAG: hypothetical protein KatS3mg114_0041 [Planctomycetaceae bacterium]
MSAIMMRRTMLNVILCVCSTLSLADGAEPLNWRALPSPLTLQKLGLELRWSNQAVINPTRDQITHLHMDEELVYVLGSQGTLTAFEVETGTQRWALSLGRYHEATFAPASNQRLVLAVVGTTMFGIDKRRGNVRWRIRLPGQPSAGPSLDDRHIYVPTLDGSLYAYEMRKVEEHYLEQRLPAWSKDAIRWRYQAGDIITSPPLTYSTLVLFGSRDGSLYAVSRDDRRVQYIFETDAPIVAPLALLGDTLFIASEDYNFYALKPSNGRVLWEFVAGTPIRKPPYSVNNHLFVTPDAGGMFCLEASDGQQRWWHPHLTQLLAVSLQRGYFLDDRQHLNIVDLQTGQSLGILPLYGYPLALTNDRTDRILLATTSGRVLMLAELGRDFPLYHKNPEHRPLLPEFEPEEQ